MHDLPQTLKIADLRKLYLNRGFCYDFNTFIAYTTTKKNYSDRAQNYTKFEFLLEISIFVCPLNSKEWVLENVFNMYP